MKKRDRLLLSVAALAVLVYAGWYVTEKEGILQDGELSLFELDPSSRRSLVQGDYLQLNYAIGSLPERTEIPPRGYLIFTRDPDGVAHFGRIQDAPEPLSAGEHLLRVRRRRAGAVRNGSILLGPESYFIPEGTADRYQNVRYGGLRIDRRGEAVLVGLWDEHRAPIR